jgi:hypothetical protein
MATYSGIMVGLQFLNAVFILCGSAGFILFVLVLLKLNKALTIWLKQNKNDLS